MAFSSLDLRAASGFRAPIKNGEGNVRSSRLAISMDRSWRTPSRLQSVAVEGSQMRYSADGVPFLNDAGSIYGLQMSGFYTSSRDGWQPLLLGTLRTTAAEESSFSDGIYYSGGGGVQYPVNPRLTLGIGALGGGGTNDRFRGYPWLLVRYQWTDHWRFETRNGVVLSFRPHPSMPRPLSSLALLFEVDRFATVSRSDDRLERSLTVRDRSWVLRGYHTLLSDRRFPIRLMVQIDLNRRIRLMESGRSLERIDLKPRPVVGIETGITF